MKQLVSILIITFMVAPVGWTALKTREHIELEAYIDWFLGNYGARRLKAKGMIPAILSNCKKHKVDPLLVAIVISNESAWKPNVTGFAKGELGVMQVHGPAARGFRLWRPDGQISAGVTWLRKSIDRCKGSTIRGLNAYQSGKCRPVQWFAKRRYRQYKKAVKKFRQ